jgi:uncharacterized lipoprotein YehR (DUF1307 family)
MGTQIHTATNLYNYITNVRQVENLRLQIRRKEKDLKSLEQLHEIYKDLGCTSMLEASQNRIAKVAVDILLLELDLKRLEEQFEVADFIRD